MYANEMVDIRDYPEVIESINDILNNTRNAAEIKCENVKTDKRMEKSLVVVEVTRRVVGKRK